MTSIIGYTRVPLFNSSASKHFSIAPVKRLYQHNNITGSLNNNCRIDSQQQRQQQDAYQNDDAYTTGITTTTTTTATADRQPSYHRIFSREMSQQNNGIIELIIDKKQQQQQQRTPPLNDTTNRTIDNKTVPPPSLLLHHNKYHSSINSNNYKIYLSIDLSTSHDYDELSTILLNNECGGNGDDENNNLQCLMNSISKIAQQKKIDFANILNLLKKLQQQQQQHRFMSCLDKYKEMILIYFPNTISCYMDQVEDWLKYTIDVDVNEFKQYKLVKEENDDQEDDNYFDGDGYFNDIHMFINHVDSLIESNSLLFSSNKKKNQLNYDASS